jgi:hypothetical protein
MGSGSALGAWRCCGVTVPRLEHAEKPWLLSPPTRGLRVLQPVPSTMSGRSRRASKPSSKLAFLQGALFPSMMYFCI